MATDVEHTRTSDVTTAAEFTGTNDVTRTDIQNATTNDVTTGVKERETNDATESHGVDDVNRHTLAVQNSNDAITAQDLTSEEHEPSGRESAEKALQNQHQSGIIVGEPPDAAISQLHEAVMNGAEDGSASRDVPCALDTPATPDQTQHQHPHAISESPPTESCAVNNKTSDTEMCNSTVVPDSSQLETTLGHVTDGTEETRVDNCDEVHSDSDAILTCPTQSKNSETVDFTAGKDINVKDSNEIKVSPAVVEPLVCHENVRTVDEKIVNKSVLPEVMTDNPRIEACAEQDNVDYITEDGTEIDSCTQEEIRSKVLELNYIITSCDLERLEKYLDSNESYLHDIFHSSNNERESLTTMACTLGLVDVIKMFDKKHILNNIQDGDGYYPIHRAAYNQHVALVRHLIDCFGDTTLLDCTKNGFNVLHVAASVGNVELIRLLAPLMPDVNVTCKNGWNALHIATHAGYVQAVEIILENGANVDQLNQDGHTPLILATERALKNLVEILLKHNAHVNFQNATGVSALYMAVQTGSVSLVNCLLDAGANINMQDRHGWCALHKATFMASERMLLLLLVKGALPNTHNMKGVTSLHLCASKLQEKREILAELLLKHGADCNIRDNTGQSPFLISVINNHVAMVTLMSQHRADVTLCDSQKYSPLYIASMNGNFSIVDLLTTHGADANQVCVEGWTPLLIAVKEGHKLIVEMLLDAGGDMNKANSNGVTPLALAAKEGTDNMLKIAYRATPVGLCKVAAMGDASLLERLQRVGVSLCMSNTLGMTSLHFAAQEGSECAVTTLLACDSTNPMVQTRDTDGNTPLHIACLHGHASIVQALTAVEPQVNLSNKAGERCLHLAAKAGESACVNVLLTKGAYVNAMDNLKQTALFHAVSNGHLQIFKSLINAGATLQVTTENFSPLHIAAEGGYTEILLLLIAGGARVNNTGTFRNTSLHLAARNGHLQTVLELIVNKADVNAENVLGKKPLHLAAYNGHSGVVEALLSADTKLELLGDDGSPLYDLSRHKDIWTLITNWISRTLPNTDQRCRAASGSSYTHRLSASSAWQQRNRGPFEIHNSDTAQTRRSSVPSQPNMRHAESLDTVRSRFVRTGGSSTDLAANSTAHRSSSFNRALGNVDRGREEQQPNMTSQTVPSSGERPRSRARVRTNTLNPNIS